MRRFQLFVALSLSAFLLVCCKGRELKSSFSENEIPRFEIDGRDVLVFDPMTCQTSCREDDRQFMVFTDTMSDYYILTLDKMPSKAGESVRGSLVWTSEFSIEKKSDLKFDVEKVEEDGWIWLWNSSSRIGVAVQRL